MEFVEFVPVGSEEGGGRLDPLGLRSSSPRQQFFSACQSFPYWTFQAVNALLHFLFVIARWWCVWIFRYKENLFYLISFHFWLSFPPDCMANLEPCLSDSQAGVKLCWPSGSALAEAGYNTLQASIQESSAWSPFLTPNAATPAALLGIPTHTSTYTGNANTNTSTNTQHWEKNMHLNEV